jgi:tRNA(adenine34) deaminase
MEDDEYFMKQALVEAGKASQENEVPVGCVIVCDGKIIARSHNQKIKKASPLAHAEVEAIKKAAKKKQTWILDDCTLYVTLEPCLMCSAVMIQARIPRLVFATKEPKFGACGSVCNAFELEGFNHQVKVTYGVCETQASNLLKDFFKNVREQKKRRATIDKN